MTFIQPSKNKNILNLVLFGMGAALLVGTFWVIVAYNQTVSMAHDISKMKSELDTLGAKSTAINNQLIGSLGSDAIASAAAKSGLVEDKKPQYFEIDQQWPIASQ